MSSSFSNHNSMKQEIYNGLGLGIVSHTYNPKGGRIQSLMLAWATYRVGGQTGLHRESLFIHNFLKINHV